MATNIAANNNPTKIETLTHSGHSADDEAVRRGAGAIVRTTVDGGASERAEVSAVRLEPGGRRRSHSPGIIADGLRTVIL